ncbi:hypothetical protein ACVMGC_000978 [Bradyrhizobium barranii subsp. barranii]|uniref:hypothetical protein n=1 Tax=Bradyrhizobium TaxID=374 RepID=UPI001BA6D86D|nr:MULTISPECIES: hypothetical protein [Bradyrhizobium]MBR0884034.1 hypothetical protein [Bradyrhizobium liaoningense]MCP1778867.1 hypothetical protein [Bradyrhizobium japonicum]MCP1958136.1 hypothetical protein [Bradyrhizobium japonicum]
MKIRIASIAAIAVILSAVPADARRGAFLSALVRGGVQGAARAGAHAGVQSYGGNKTYGADTLTVEQLEKCIVFAQELDKSSTDVDAFADTIETESRAISQAQQLLAYERDLVDRYSDASVNAYNRKLAAMRQRIGSHNENVDKAKTFQTSHNLRVGMYNMQCAKKYYADDMEAARLKLSVKLD